MHHDARDPIMLDWLKSQVRVLEAWREELAARPDSDLAVLSGLERHHDWLSSEVSRLAG